MNHMKANHKNEKIPSVDDEKEIPPTAIPAVIPTLSTLNLKRDQKFESKLLPSGFGSQGSLAQFNATLNLPQKTEPLGCLTLSHNLRQQVIKEAKQTPIEEILPVKQKTKELQVPQTTAS